MLLQRASAGSGKTHKLAKTYIRLFISERDNATGRYMLRHPEELRGEHGHILGVTFTNKATNEMKTRIVERLAALAAPHPEPGMEPDGYKAPCYLKDFTGEEPSATVEDDIIFTAAGAPASRRDISAVCRRAVNILLNDYGNFNISTIDTFFQSVLRTLAYELRLNDNYHVELNDEYLAQVGVDETLLSMRGDDDGGVYAREWASDIISERLERGEAWNPFARSSQSATSVYGELYSLARKMPLESFRLALEKTGGYFRDPARFRRFLKAVKAEAGEPKAKRSKCVRLIDAFVRDMQSRYGAAWRDMLQKGVWTSLTALRTAKIDMNPEALGISKKILGHGHLYKGEITGRDHPYKKDSPVRNDPEALSRIGAIGDGALEWAESAAYWSAVMSRLHYMGLLHEIRAHIDEFREENNIIPLSETNEILRGIIGEEQENPFIYERLGTRLCHYLLDEFQDTSEMQWENLRPLLDESEAAGYDNLIIGDAKQSIYRFRNAEPELINSRVQAEIPRTRVLPDMLPAGSSAYYAVNTNWRSSAHVVDFNNRLFDAMARRISAEIPEIGALYANVSQAIHNGRMPGYVTMTFSKPEEGDCYSVLGEQIDELRSRGYRLRDITVLVNKNSEGQRAIRALMDYNDRMTGADGWTPIEIISEESLKVGESVAVKIILAVLSMVSGSLSDPDSQAEPDSGEKPRRRHIHRHELAQMVANYHFYRALHPDEDARAALESDINRIVPPEEIERMLEVMPAVTLPALVEEIASRFVAPETSSSQTAYLSAFQDAVLEYCESYPSDVNSFLAWWDENGSRRSISAPDGIDALQVMTIHKSKGLEFQAVLIPQAEWTLGPEKEQNEIIWVSHLPRGIRLENPEDCPPLIPITPDGRSMSDPASPFYDAYEEYRRKCVTDQLNKTYVAFTRAIRELHVCAPVPKTAKAGCGAIGYHIRQALGAIQPAMAGDWKTADADTAVYGSPTTYRRNPEEERRELEKRERQRVINRYCQPPQTGIPVPRVCLED